MDTSKEYIKMCDCPEIQDAIRFFYDTDEDTNFWDGPLCKVWLPRQDQLWAMLPKNQDYHCLYIATDEVGHDNWHFSPVVDEINEIWAATLEQALTQGVMWELHQKKWDGSPGCGWSR